MFVAALVLEAINKSPFPPPALEVACAIYPLTCALGIALTLDISTPKFEAPELPNDPFPITSKFV